jgi:RNA polymerase sigma-70 factor (ECF subfamily)
MNAVECPPEPALEPDAAAIARGLRRQDADLIDRLIELHQDRLFRFLAQLCGIPELAKDLCQETWLRVLEKGHQFDGRSEFRTWLYSVARNLAYDHFRRKSTVSLESLAGEDEAPPELADPLPVSWENVARSEEGAHLRAALATLPAEYREVVVLRFQDGLRLEEIATVAGLPLGTVKSRLSRALPLLLLRLKGIQP